MNFSSEDAAKIAGKKTDELEEYSAATVARPLFTKTDNLVTL